MLDRPILMVRSVLPPSTAIVPPFDIHTCRRGGFDEHGGIVIALLTKPTMQPKLPNEVVFTLRLGLE
jgi:hypothetical protein